MASSVSTVLGFTSSAFEDNHQCVSWRGELLRACPEFTSFLQTKVLRRLDDAEGAQDLHRHLQGLELTGMGKAHLEEVLNAQVLEDRDWAAGEALAEAYLMETEGVLFPWNMERDKRNPFASLPGADLVGFVKEDSSYRLALGEVKTSSETACPPQVVSGRSGGLGHQIDNLANDLGLIYQLLKWLHPRTRNGEFATAFEDACTRYFNTGKKTVSLFGVLLRDTSPNALDLSARGTALRQSLSNPTRCNLVALYLPWRTEQLISHIRQGGGS